MIVLSIVGLLYELKSSLRRGEKKYFPSSVRRGVTEGDGVV
jgi:hypothetical protein